jgi:hypothetical protein
MDRQWFRRLKSTKLSALPSPSRFAMARAWGKRGIAAEANKKMIFGGEWFA